MIRQSFRNLLVTVVAMMPLAGAWAAPAPGNNSANSLEGVYQIVGTPDPASGLAPFYGLTSVAKDGTVTTVDPELGAGVGKAYRLQGDDYGVTFYGYIDLGFKARFQVEATLTSTGPDTGTGVFRTIVTDISGGTVLFEYEGTLESERLPVQPY
jgi:hypothetical protein